MYTRISHGLTGLSRGWLLISIIDLRVLTWSQNSVTYTQRRCQQLSQVFCEYTLIHVRQGRKEREVIRANSYSRPRPPPPPLPSSSLDTTTTTTITTHNRYSHRRHPIYEHGDDVSEGLSLSNECVKAQIRFLTQSCDPISC